MNKRFLIPIAWTITALTLVIVAASLYLLWFDRDALTNVQDSFVGQMFYLIAYSTAPIVGGLISSRKPHNAYGWVWLGMSLGIIFGWFIESYLRHLLIAGSELNTDIAITVLFGDSGWFIGFTMTAFVLLLFPTGQYLSSGWRNLGRLLIIILVTGLVLLWIAPARYGPDLIPLGNPLGIQGPVSQVATMITSYLVFVVLGGILISGISLVLRFKKASATEHQQLKWFAYGGSIFCILLGSDFVFKLPGLWENAKEAIMFGALPVSVGIAILRHRLWDIDVIIRRTLIYGAMTAALALVYAGSVIVLQQVFQVLTGGENRSQLAIVVSTLGVAALFNPLRKRVQERIDRRFFRQKYDAERILAAFSDTARQQTDLDALTRQLVEAVNTSLQPEHASLWLKPAMKASVPVRPGENIP